MRNFQLPLFVDKWIADEVEPKRKHGRMQLFPIQLSWRIFPMACTILLTKTIPSTNCNNKLETNFEHRQNYPLCVEMKDKQR